MFAGLKQILSFTLYVEPTGRSNYNHEELHRSRRICHIVTGSPELAFTVALCGLAMSEIPKRHRGPTGLSRLLFVEFTRSTNATGVGNAKHKEK